MAVALSVTRSLSRLLKHLNGILNYRRVKVRFGVVEAIDGNIRMPINRGRGYKNLRYLLLKVGRVAATNTGFVAFSCRDPALAIRVRFRWAQGRQERLSGVCGIVG
jgi:hypothetical protein